MQHICIRRTEDCLKQNMEKLDQLAELLLKKETLNYQDVEDLLGQKKNLFKDRLTRRLFFKDKKISVVDPYPDWIRIQWSLWIRI